MLSRNRKKKKESRVSIISIATIEEEQEEEHEDTGVVNIETLTIENHLEKLDLRSAT